MGKRTLSLTILQLAWWNNGDGLQVLSEIVYMEPRDCASCKAAGTINQCRACRVRLFKASDDSRTAMMHCLAMLVEKLRPHDKIMLCNESKLRRGSCLYGYPNNVSRFVLNFEHNRLL